jgi:hypothetical protein
VWDIVSVPLLAIPVALLTLLFAMTLAPARPPARVHEVVAAGTSPSDPDPGRS